MKQYPKIQTLFKRDNTNVIIPEEFTLYEFDYLKNSIWEATEKIDGTNIRIVLEFSGNNVAVDYRGRTDKADIPIHLQLKLHRLFDDIKWEKIFDVESDTKITIFGEGYGCKIQKGGNYLRNDVNFILFDVNINDKWWLNREDCEDIAKKLNIPIVPIVGYMTIPEAIAKVEEGFKSLIAENKDYIAEGLVLKIPCGLLFRNGNRIITKIKHSDFVKYNKKVFK